MERAAGTKGVGAVKAVGTSAGLVPAAGKGMPGDELDSGAADAVGEAGTPTAVN